MRITPAFEGLGDGYGVAPVVVELQNPGGSASGVVRVTVGDEEVDYPVELPQGSVKRLTTYPKLAYGSAEVTLLTNRGLIRKSIDLRGPYGRGNLPVLTIGDDSGTLAFIRPKRGQGDSTFQDAYCLPELAPDRPIGYSRLSAIVLAAGSERLTDGSVDAIRSWVLTGGTVMILGGASSPTAADPRWSDLLPVRSPRTYNVAQSKLLRKIGGVPTPPLTLFSGPAILGIRTVSEDGIVVVGERAVGLGRCIYLAFNPLEPPLSTWNGRAEVVTTYLKSVNRQQVDQYLATLAQEKPDTSGRRQVAADPFSMKLPSANYIFTILAAYFVVVIPVNFLVLRRLRRGELAWVTAPLIALGFAGVLFSSAQALYSAEMSTAATGTLFGRSGDLNGMFVGKTQLFVPRSGTFDLQFHNVDSLGTVAALNSWEPDSSNGELTPVDKGEITVPDMRTNNLAFREINLRQQFPVGEWFKIDVIPKDGTRWTCSVANTSRFLLRQGRIVFGSEVLSIGDLAAGRTKSLVLKRPKSTKVDGRSEPILPFLGRQNSVALLGEIDGIRPGPQIGRAVADRTKVNLVMFSREGLGR